MDSPCGCEMYFMHTAHTNTHSRNKSQRKIEAFSHLPFNCLNFCSDLTKVDGSFCGRGLFIFLQLTVPGMYK